LRQSATAYASAPAVRRPGTSRAACNEHCSLQHDTAFTIGENDVRPIIDERTVPPIGDACDHPIRKTKKLQRLVDQVRAEIKPDAAAWHSMLAPALAPLRPESIDF